MVCCEKIVLTCASKSDTGREDKCGRKLVVRMSAFIELEHCFGVIHVAEARPPRMAQIRAQHFYGVDSHRA
jgi:L-lactate permease